MKPVFERRSPWRLALTRALSALLFAATACSLSAQGQSPSPNLLMIVVDDLGPEFIAAYGRRADAPVTPVMGLAKRVVASPADSCRKKSSVPTSNPPTTS